LPPQATKRAASATMATFFSTAFMRQSSWFTFVDEERWVINESVPSLGLLSRVLLTAR
jgi:hypothetical protein